MTTPTQHGHDASDSGETLAGAEALFVQVDRLERELAELGERLARSERLAALGSLAAVVAHELNNVLTPVTSYAQLALAAPDELTLTRKALESAVEGVARAERITASVLGMTREDTPASLSSAGDSIGAEASGGAMTCGLRDTVASALSCLTASASEDGIEVCADVADVPVAMPGAELYRVLVNVLLNAKRAVMAQAGRRMISVSSDIVARGENRTDGDAAASLVEIVVMDNGPGVPLAVRDRLFEPFATCPVNAGTQGDGTAEGGVLRGDGAALPDGSGLGLSICRELVERAGGEIVADPPQSSAEGGAVFRVRLPVAG
ncbi:HAMP domain-containing sensor histidine kinase [Phycisphaeraceae bacterium D3-23]